MPLCVGISSCSKEGRETTNAELPPHPVLQVLLLAVTAPSMSVLPQTDKMVSNASMQCHLQMLTTLNAELHASQGVPPSIAG